MTDNYSKLFLLGPVLTLGAIVLTIAVTTQIIPAICRPEYLCGVKYFECTEKETTQYKPNEILRKS
jgi:hypothetical protein